MRRLLLRWRWGFRLLTWWAIRRGLCRYCETPLTAVNKPGPEYVYCTSCRDTSRRIMAAVVARIQAGKAS